MLHVTSETSPSPASPECGVQVRLLAEARVLAGAAEAAGATAGLVLGRASSAELFEVGRGEDADPPEAALDHVRAALQDAVAAAAAAAARGAHGCCNNVISTRLCLRGEYSVFEL